MGQEILHVNMFGKCSLIYAEKQINCNSNRSRLLWNILTYLIYHRGELINAEDLIAVIWESPNNVNPSGAMRTAIFRARQMLNELVEGTDCHFIVSQNGGYMWNPTIPVVLDIEQFEESVMAIDKAPNAIEGYLAALELYSGKFLDSQSAEMWVMPIQVYYHNVFETVIDRLIPLLEKAGKYKEGITICRKALQIDPYSEKLYQYLMRFYIMLDERQEVIKVYEDMSKLLLSTFGIMPDQESRALYREALSSIRNNHTLSPEIVIEQLTEHEDIQGALICDYDFFKILYQAHARSIMRSGTVIHTALLTLKNRKDHEVSKTSLSHAMDHLEKHMSQLLRKGDVITRCSSSQFIIMLLASDYESSIKVCQRFISVFENKYPHSPVCVDYFVQALIPSAQS